MVNYIYHTQLRRLFSKSYFIFKKSTVALLVEAEISRTPVMEKEKGYQNRFSLSIASYDIYSCEHKNRLLMKSF